MPAASRGFDTEPHSRPNLPARMGVLIVRIFPTVEKQSPDCLASCQSLYSVAPEVIVRGDSRENVGFRGAEPATFCAALQTTRPKSRETSRVDAGKPRAAGIGLYTHLPAYVRMFNCLIDNFPLPVQPRALSNQALLTGAARQESSECTAACCYSLFLSLSPPSALDVAARRSPGGKTQATTPKRPVS
jgi:hypothetical protein